jgi:hypothetical protein
MGWHKMDRPLLFPKGAIDMWIIITIIGSLCAVFFIFVLIFGSWKVSLTRLADSYIYGRESENLSSKDAFLKTLKFRYQLDKTGSTAHNPFRQNMEYRYECILEAKDFVEEAISLAVSRSMVGKEMYAGDDIKKDMIWEPYYKDIRNKNYGLLDLLVCGMAIERWHIVKKKSYNDIVKMVRGRFKGWGYFEKYLNEAQNA